MMFKEYFSISFSYMYNTKSDLGGGEGEEGGDDV